MTARLAIVGTRVLAHPWDAGYAYALADWVIETLSPEVVISGGARGCDTIAERAAIDRGYSEAAGTLWVYRPLRRTLHGYGGYQWRDAQIAAACTHLLRLHCAAATTYGSGWTADEAERLGASVRRWLVCPS